MNKDELKESIINMIKQGEIVHYSINSDLREENVSGSNYKVYVDTRIRDIEIKLKLPKKSR